MNFPTNLMTRSAAAWAAFPSLPRRFTLVLAMALIAGTTFAEDLSSLPEYRPAQKVSGLIRSWGNPHMADVMKLWQTGFRNYHPDVLFFDYLKGSSTAISGVNQNVSDLALMGRQIFTFEYYGIYRRSLMLPVEIEVATGSLNVPYKSFAVTVFVHKDNPLSKVTFRQLDGIFGAQREGGWQGMKWNRAMARTAKDNLRLWGQLGLTGEWANQPIHPYGPPGLYPGGYSFFQRKVLGGADTWAEGLMEYDDRKQLMEALGQDRYGIAYTGLCYQNAQTKALAVAEKEGGPYVEPTTASVASRAYPLARPVYIYFAPDTPGGDPANPKVDPKVKEFLRYILSRQGQQDVQKEGDYLPLTADVLHEQLKKLE
ncbi:MAG: substrate-binding domain-containing protein [Opitutaceae bacterium]|nr:substrate-binding domain-containing protein [Opitutaceae bacterium]